MLSLKISLAAILASAAAVSLDNLQTDATLHDYMVYQSGVADNNPPWCEVPYNSLDLSSVTAFGGVTKDTCGSCIQVCGSVGCKHLLVIDQCSRPDGELDISTGAGEQICGATTGHCQVSVKSAAAQNCAHIWNGRMFYDYTPLYGGFSELKKYVDAKGAAPASSAPASSSVETSAPAPTSFVLPTSSLLPPTSSSVVVVVSSSPAPVLSSSPAPVFTPPTTTTTPLQVETTPAVVPSAPAAYAPPVVVPPFPFTNSTHAAPSLPSATVASRGTANVCPFGVTKTVTPTTTFFVTVSGTPTPMASTPTEEPEEEVESQGYQEPESAPPSEEEQATEPGQEQQQQQQPQSSSPELTTTKILRATQTLQIFTTLTTRVVAVQSVTAPTAPTGVPLSTGTPGGRQAFQGQGWNSTSPGAAADSGSGYERRSEHLRGHVARGGSVGRILHGHAHGHGGL